jgi:hypothetical protein
MEIIMTPHPQTPAATIPSAFEELMRTDLVNWKALATQVNDPVVARMIVEVLDAHPAMRERRIAVYLAARVTVQRSRVAYARAHATGRRAAAFARGSMQFAQRLFGGFRRIAEHARPTRDVAGSLPATIVAAASATAVADHGVEAQHEPAFELTLLPIDVPATNDAHTMH